MRTAAMTNEFIQKLPDFSIKQGLAELSDTYVITHPLAFH